MMPNSEAKYTITKPLGRGGMGQVWAALKHGDGGMQMPCAIKVLWPALAMTEEDRERFYGEARIAAQLDHGRIVKVIDTTVVQGSPSLVMEWVDGVNLRVLVDKARAKEIPRVGINVALYVVGEMLAALAYAHGRTIGGEDAAVIHSDVTPGNILISSSGEVKLTDFGIARFVRSSDKTMSHAVGTPRYMSAEQMRGRIYTATDIYGLGVVLHELLEGDRYLQGCASQEFQFKVLGGHVPDLTHTDIPDWVDALRRRMLSPDPESRPNAEDAHAMIVELAPNYALAALELKRLYLRCVGSARSGFTELVNLRHGGDTNKLLESMLGPGAGESDDPDSSSSTTRRNDPNPNANADPDAPAVLRRGGRPRISQATIDHTNTSDPVWSGEDGHPTGPGPAAGAEAEVEPTAILPCLMEESGTEPRSPLGPVTPARESTLVQAVGHAQHPRPAHERVQTGVEVVAGTESPAQAWPGGGELAVPVQSNRLRGVAIVSGAFAFLLAGVFVTSAAMTLEAGKDDATSESDPASEVAAVTAPPVPEPTAEATPEATVASPATEPGPEPDPEPDPEPKLAIEPEPEPKPEPDPEPEPETVAPAQAPTASTKPKPKPKPASVPSVTVTFLIAGASKQSQVAQIKANSKRLSTSNGFKSTKLQPGNYRIQWRWGDDGDWHEMQTLHVEPNLPTGSYYSVSLDPKKMAVKKTLGGK